VKRRIPAACLVILLLAAAAWSIGRTWSADVIARSDHPAILLLAESRDPFRWDIPYRRGRILEEEGDIPGARDAYRLAAGRNPLSGQAHYKLGVQEERLGRRDVAIEELRRAAEVAPNNPDILFRVASYQLRWYFETRNVRLLGESLRAFRRAAALDPDFCRRILEKLSRVFRLPGRLRWVRPETPWGHRSLGEMFLEKKEWDLALEEFRQWERLADAEERPAIRIAQGVALARAGRDAPALRVLTEGAGIAPDPGAYFREVYDRMRAAGRLHVVLPLFRERSMTILEGRALRELGRADEARSILRKIGTGEAHLHLYLLEMDVKDPIAAERHLREAVRLDPGSALYRHHLARFLEGRGRLREALIEAEEASRLAPRQKEYALQVIRLRSKMDGSAQD
jgi:tetratricopeptide (TPR) repeat protein